MTKKALVICISIALVFGCVGFFVGRYSNNSQVSENDEAYIKGWTAWFSGYGTSETKSAYFEQYTFGRKYKYNFNFKKEAFVQGYNDGCYHVNGKESNNSLEIIESKYKEYFD